MGRLIVETPFSEITAFLELLTSLGIEREDLKRFRADRVLATNTVEFMWQRDEFFRFHKGAVRDVIELVAGGEREIPVNVFNKWQPFVMFAIRCMERFYCDPLLPEVYKKAADYYRECWDKFRHAKDATSIIAAIEYLRVSIKEE